MRNLVELLQVVLEVQLQPEAEQDNDSMTVAESHNSYSQETCQKIEAKYYSQYPEKHKK